MTRFQILLIIILFFSFSIVCADKIEFSYLPENMTVSQGDEISTRIILTNIYNQSIEWSKVEFQKPSGIEIEKSISEIELIAPDGRVSFGFDIKVKDDAEPGLKEIKIWSEDESGSDLSKKYSIFLKVENKTTETTTITTSISTATETAIAINTTSSVSPTSTTTKMESEENESKPKLKYVIIISIIVLVIIFMIILSRKKS